MIDLKRLSFALVCAATMTTAVTAQVPQVVTFDSAWSIINRTHFDTTFNGVDWQKVRIELRPKAEAARTNDELRPILTDMLGRLRESHFSIIPQSLNDTTQNQEWNADIGMDLRYLGRDFVVTEVEPDGPAARAGVKVGWVVRKIGDQTAEDIGKRADRVGSQYPKNARNALAARRGLYGAAGSTVTLELRDENNRTRKLELTRRRDPGMPAKFGNLPTFFTRFSARPIEREGVSVGLIWFNVWMTNMTARLDSAVDRMRGSDGIIVDLRGNPGGLGALSMGVAGHFVDSARSLGAMNTRGGKLQFKINPRRVSTAGERVVPFSGPVAILMDELSGSTSEVFAGGLQSLGRVRVFGTKSMGAVLPAQAEKLPNGDILYHAIADFVTADGTLLEGRGVIPDEQVSLKRADLLEGRDTVLEAAMKWIAAEARARKTTSEIKR